MAFSTAIGNGNKGINRRDNHHKRNALPTPQAVKHRERSAWEERRGMQQEPELIHTKGKK
jgi:hypothetical protein